MIVNDASRSRRAVAGPLSAELPTTVIPDLNDEDRVKLLIERPLGAISKASRFGMNASGDITGTATSTGF